MGDQFRDVEETFSLLKEKFLDRKISQREFIDSLKQLRIKDDDGRFWMIGARSGKWYAFEGGEWVEAKPPSQMERKAICIACAFENDLEAEFCTRCGRRDADEASRAPGSTDVTPQDARAEAAPEAPGEDIVVRSLHILSFFWFFGVSGLFAGILFGLAAGVTGLFPGFAAGLGDLHPCLDQEAQRGPCGDPSGSGLASGTAVNSRARRSRTGTRVAANGSKIVSRKTTSSRRSAVLGRAVLRTAAILGIEPRRLAQVIGGSADSVLRLSRGTYSLKSPSKSWELAALVVRLYQGLDTIMAGDEISMRFWMWSPNTDLHATPAEHIVTVQGLVSVVGYVESFRVRA